MKEWSYVEFPHFSNKKNRKKCISISEMKLEKTEQETLSQ
jgi:hypothetical protein